MIADTLVWFILVVSLNLGDGVSVAVLRADDLAQCQEWRTRLVHDRKTVAISTCIEVPLEPTHGR